MASYTEVFNSPMRNFRKASAAHGGYQSGAAGHRPAFWAHSGCESSETNIESYSMWHDGHNEQLAQLGDQAASGLLRLKHLSCELVRNSRSMSDQHELEERVKAAQAECERLRKENVRLRTILGVHDPVPEHPVPSAPGPAPTPLPFGTVPEALTPEQKIALFRGLFRGREDVYAVRWEGKGGKAGYSPVGVI